MVDGSTAHAAAVFVIEERTAETKVPRLWSAKALATRWNISRAYVYKLYKRGLLPGVYLGGALRFSEQAVLDFLDRQRIAPGGRD